MLKVGDHISYKYVSRGHTDKTIIMPIIRVGRRWAYAGYRYNTGAGIETEEFRIDKNTLKVAPERGTGVTVSPFLPAIE